MHIEARSVELVRRPVLRLLELALLLALTACVPSGLAPAERAGWEDVSKSSFAAGPYLIPMHPGAMAVVVKAPDSKPPVVEWWVETNGTAPAEIHRTAAREHVDRWFAVLTPLPRGKTIGYRVRSSVGDAGPFSFKTSPERGARFTFAVFGDTRSGHTVHRAVIESLVRERVDFFIHTGDMVETGGLEPQWDVFFQIERPLLASAPIVPASGNHDMGPRDVFGRVFLTSVWADSLEYYYQDWGDLRLVVVDTGIECREGCTQSYFARRALADGAKKGMLLAMAMHVPPYSSGAHGSDLSIRRAIGDLAEAYGVELVFAGHDHDYERTKPIKGTTYMVSGAAGAPVRPVRPQAFTDHVRTEAHYVLIDVAPTRLTVRAVNLAGETFDKTVIDPVPPKGAL